MAKGASTHIDWSTAQVDATTLTVALSSAPGKAWKRRFSAVVAILDQRATEWGDIAVHKHKVRVADVRQGAEPQLGHLLEAAVLEANASLDDDNDEQADGNPSPHPDREESFQREAPSVDDTMTAAFRALAGQHSADDEP